MGESVWQELREECGRRAVSVEPRVTGAAGTVDEPFVREIRGVVVVDWPEQAEVPARPETFAFIPATFALADLGAAPGHLVAWRSPRGWAATGLIHIGPSDEAASWLERDRERYMSLWFQLSRAVHDVPSGDIARRLATAPWESDDPRVAAAWAQIVAEPNLAWLEWEAAGVLTPYVRRCRQEAIRQIRQRVPARCPL